MKTLKYSTKNLTCYYCNDCYEIFENTQTDLPIAIYYNVNKMKLSNRFPVPETSYIYFDEMCEIIQLLYDMEK